MRRHAPALGAVRCSGAERWVRIHPAACGRAVVCLHADVLHGAERGSPRMKTPKVLERSPVRILSRITMREMFLKCFSFLF